MLELGGNPDSSVAGLTLEPTGAATSGLRLIGTRAHDLAVHANGASSLVGGVELFGETALDDASVDVGPLAGHAITVYSGTATVTDSTVTAPEGAGLGTGASETTVRRSTLNANIGAIALARHLTISDSVIDMRGHAGGGGSVGVYAFRSGNGPMTAAADADRLTIVGSTPSGTETIGSGAYAEGAGMSAGVHLRDSVINGIGVPIARTGDNCATASIATDRSAYPNSVAPPSLFDVGPGSLVEHNRLNVSPRFIDGAAGNFRLAADSPLIDAGTPGGLPAGAADRDRRPRASDGNGDCAHVSDIGAFEYQGTKARAVATAAATASPGPPVGFSAAGSCIPGPEAPTIRWSFDDGAAVAGATVTHAFNTPGRHTATVTVTDGHGHAAQATASVDVTAPAAAAPAAPAASAAPRIRRLRVAPTRVQIGSRLPKLVRTAVRRPLATIRFQLSKRATITLRFAKVGRNGTARTLKTKVRIKARKGRNRIRFAARLTRTVALAPGTYRLTAVATSRAGARSKRARTRFTASKPTRE